MNRHPPGRARFEYEVSGPVLDVYDGSPLLDDAAEDNLHRMTRPIARVPFKGNLEHSLREAVSDIYRHTAQNSPLHIEFYKRNRDVDEKADVELDWTPEKD